MIKSDNRKTKWLGWTLLGGCILFYMVFYWIDGIQLCKDSAGYINMDISREPLYPAFLALNRGIFGEALYLNVVVIIQCVLAGYAMWKLADVVYQYAKSKIGLPLLTIFFQMAVALICRFIADRKAIYANEIATEGLTFALYTLFIAQLFLCVRKEKGRNLIAVFLLATVLVGIRKQMLIVYPILFCVFTVRLFSRKYKVNKYIILLTLIILSFFATLEIDRVYNYALRGEFVTHTRDSAFFLVTALYVAEVDDAAAFKDPETAELFREMMVEVDRQKLGFKDATNNWKSRSIHYGNSYDAIGYGIAYPKITEYIQQHHASTEVEEAIKFDYFGKDLSLTLVPKNMGRMVNVIFSNAIMGFVNTVANVKNYLSLYSLLVYIAYLLLFAYLVKQKKLEEGLLIGEITLFAILSNVACVALTIFSQPRYMIYNMPLFYLALVWMGYEVFLMEKEKRNG